jgi:hypothetical protein
MVENWNFLEKMDSHKKRKEDYESCGQIALSLEIAESIFEKDHKPKVM